MHTDPVFIPLRPAQPSCLLIPGEAPLALGTLLSCNMTRAQARFRVADSRTLTRLADLRDGERATLVVPGSLLPNRKVKAHLEGCDVRLDLEP